MKSTCTVEEVLVHLIEGVTQGEAKKVGAAKISDCSIANMMMKSK